jgi:hypothetical protein
MWNFSAPSFNLHSEHSGSTVRTHRLFSTLLLRKRQTEFWKSFKGLYDFFRFYLCQIARPNIWVDKIFQASEQKIFEFRFRLNSLKFSASFFLWYPKAHVHSLFVFFPVLNVGSSVTSGSLVRRSCTQCVSVSNCVWSRNLNKQSH